MTRRTPKTRNAGRLGRPAKATTSKTINQGHHTPAVQPYKNIGLKPPKMAAAPMVVSCMVCNAALTLPADTPRARKAGKGPRDLMSQHISEHLKQDQDAAFIAGCRWLFEMLFFRCPDEPAAWRRSVLLTLDQYLGVA